MRKHIFLTILLLCLHIAARGQTITSLADIDLSGLPQPTQAKALRYWFDDDDGSEQTISLLSGKTTLDVSALMEGLHTLHFQIVDTEDHVTYIRSTVFLKFGEYASTRAQSLRIWFDDDAASAKVTNLTNGIQTLDVSALLDGLHTIHYQVKGADDQLYYMASGLFIKSGSMVGTDSVKATKLLYWYDDETTILAADISEGAQMLDASGLVEGLHTLHYQVLCNNGQMTSSMSTLFMRVTADAGGTVAKNLRYWFDDDQTATVAEITDGVLLLDASALTEGLHTIHYQIADSKGMLYAPYSSVFLKINDDDSSAVHSLRYWFDEDASTVKVIDAVSGTQTLDVADLPIGLHTLHYQLNDNNDNLSTPVTGVFMKIFDKVIEGGENRVTKYQYWLNNNIQTMQTVTLNAADNPYTLIALLPMQKEPIHSDCFHFEIADGQPMIYAKNIFHIRFYDARDYLSDGEKSFVDYSVEQKVSDVEWLEPGVHATTVKPAENAIKWYQLTAQRGDSLTFKTDYPCSIQLFSPSGNELYNVSGIDAIEYGGSYAPEDGTYYLALHDVTANKCSNLGVDYQHIDKYAVLSYTPDTIGTAVSFVEMRLDGNGYDKLEKAELVLDGSAIVADSLNSVSKSLSIIRFPLYGNEETGDYDLRLIFNDNDIIDTLLIDKGVSLLPIEIGNIEIAVNPSKRTGYPYPVTISVTNTGNVSMLYVPFNIATSFDLSVWRANHSTGDYAWSSMYTMNFNVQSAKAYEGDSITYSPYTTSDNLFGTGLPGMVLHGFIPVLGPHETRDYIVGFVGSGHARFNLYAWTGRPMNAIYEEEEGESNIYSVWKYIEKFDDLANNTNSRKMKKAPPDYEGMNNVLNTADHINENASRHARAGVGIGLAAGGIVNGLRLRQIHAYDDDDFAREVLSDYREDLEQNMPDPSQIASIGGLPDWFAALLGLQQQQACCGYPMPAAHLIEILAPGDPNDIYGYTSDAGSKFMKVNTTDLFYNIEFENDPKIANASAHTIVVKDTLDASRFDLTTFAATGVKIGKVDMKLNGEKNFSKKTMDLRPAVDVIAQVSLSYDEQKGIATWTIESLDPISIEPTTDAMQGVLPVNTNGNGQGELTFDIKLKPGMAEGDSVSNRAGIIFDDESVIMTPSWTNTVDATSPKSNILEVTMATDTTAYVRLAFIDELSKPWIYNLYVQEDIDGDWQHKAVNVPVDSVVLVSVKEGINYGFYVVATDSAGNVEQKNAIREYTMNLGGVIAGDVNGDGVVNLTDASWIVRYFVGRKPDGFVDEAVDVDGDGNVNLSDAQKVVRIFVGKNN